jgi:Protein of unknown function (DUF1566)
MKRTLSYALGLVSLGMIALASGPASAVNANGPYYATPSWDQKLPASTRFIVLTNWNNEAVLDRETGLVWETVPSTVGYHWIDASSHCLARNTGGRSGWRLPTMQELMSLVDRSMINPALPSGHPFTAQLTDYWSATAIDGFTDFARLLNLSSGTLAQTPKSTSLFPAWCVRGGQGVDAQ